MIGGVDPVMDSCAPLSTLLPSRNHDGRQGHPVDMLVIHYTDMDTAAAALDRLTDPSANVSAHYVIEEDGHLWQLVPEPLRAWHAGESYWRGATNINQRSIGIELVNPGHQPFPDAQMHCLRDLCRALCARHGVEKRNVVGHSDIAPTRKQDPGPLFAWEWLANAGVGLWPFPHKNVTPDALTAYGYDTRTPDATLASTRAATQHFKTLAMSPARLPDADSQ